MDRSTPLGSNEISISMGSRKSTPISLEEPPCTLSDFPTILNEETDIRRYRSDPSLEAFKFIRIQHLRTPIVDNSQEVTSRVFDNLIKLQKSYDLPPEMIGRFKILDASYYGKPQSVLRLALANARSKNSAKVTINNLNFALEKFNKNFDNNFETWRDLFTEAGIDPRAKIMLKLSPDERNVVRAIEKLQNRDGCVTVGEISSELSTLKKHTLEQLLEDLTTRRGVLIRKLPDCYRVIPWK